MAEVQRPHPSRSTADGEMARRLRETDWSRTPLGPMDAWPASLRIAVGICMSSRFPMFVWWGEQHINLYNDAYIPVLGQRHPEAFGKPARDFWEEVWPVLGPQADAVMKRGEATWNERVLLVMERNGYAEDTYFTWSYSPIADEAGKVVGLFCACTEETGRVHVEEERQRLADQRQLALDAASMGWWHYDPATQVSTWDDRFGEIFGIEGRQIDNEVILNRLHPDDLPMVWAAVGAALDPRDPKPYSVEYRIDRNGETRWIEAHGTAEFVGEGAARRAVSFVGTVADVTEHKQVETELREREASFRHLADAMPQIVWSARADGLPTYFNRRWYDYTGLTQLPVNDEYRAMVLVEEDHSRVMRVWAQSLKHETPFECEYRLRRRDGALRWHLARAVPIREPDGRVERWFGTATDIHEVKRAEAELRESRDQMEMVVRGARVGVWYCTLPFDRLVWDETVKRHFHLDPDESVTIDTFYERLHPDDRERTRAAIDRSIADHTPYDIDYRTVSADGHQTHWIRAIGRTFYNDAGQPIRFDGITMDVSERKQIERDRERVIDAERAARAEAERVSQMKDEFLATLSHELRTPLNAMYGWAQILLRQKDTGEEVRKGLDIIERNARAQSQIIEDLLDMSRIISGKVRLDVARIDLAATVAAAVETSRPAAQNKGVRLQSVIDPLLDVVVAGDASRIQQVLWNLLTNAIKFTPRDGRVQVVLERVNSHVEVSVIDTGEGIAGDFLPFVFDRFRQADASTTRRHGGLGLGLSIVKQLVELHGGTVRVKSAGPGRGSTFSVALPLTVVHPTDDNAVDDRRHPKVGHVASGDFDPCEQIEGVRVLVVDDEADARVLLERLLTDCKAVVATASTADEAIALLSTRKFDVLISDIGMPIEDGYMLMRRVRALPPDRNGTIPGIALTAYARSQDRVRAVNAGFLMHIAKPVEPMELIAMVAAAAERSASAGAKKAANAPAE